MIGSCRYYELTEFVNKSLQCWNSLGSADNSYYDWKSYDDSIFYLSDYNASNSNAIVIDGNNSYLILSTSEFTVLNNDTTQSEQQKST